MDDEIARLQRLVAASAAEFNRAVIEAFQVLNTQGTHAGLQGLSEQCYLTAGEYESNLNSLLAVLNTEPVRYAEEITRIYKHKVLKKQAWDSLAPLLGVCSGRP